MNNFVEITDSNGKPITINKELITDIRPCNNDSCYIRLSGGHEVIIKEPYHIAVHFTLGIIVSEYKKQEIDPNITKDSLGIY